MTTAVGTLQYDVTPVGAAVEQRLTSGEPLQATFPAGEPLPTKDDPQLAVVLVPTEEPTDASSPEADEPWVFPFSKPLPPEPGDNQAAAYNTTDGSVAYDIAFAMVGTTENEVLNVNEAHAYASCSDCVTVAVAFQVVLIVGDSQVVAPQNLAVAANYKCFTCITAALAKQLVLTVPETPTPEKMLALSQVWAQLDELAANITSYSLQEISTALDGIQAQIITVLDAAPVLPGTSVSPSPTSPTTDSSTSTPTTSSPTSSSSASSTPTDSPTPTESASTGTTSTEPTSTGSTSTGSTSTEPTSTSSTSPSPTSDPSASTSPSP